jgi:hypothetical protein
VGESAGNVDVDTTGRDWRTEFDLADPVFGDQFDEIADDLVAHCPAVRIRAAFRGGNDAQVDRPGAHLRQEPLALITGRASARSGGSGGPTTWQAPRCTCRAGQVPG